MYNNREVLKTFLIEKKKYDLLSNCNKIIITDISNLILSFSEAFDQLETNKANIHFVIPIYYFLEKKLN